MICTALGSGARQTLPNPQTLRCIPSGLNCPAAVTPPGRAQAPPCATPQSCARPAPRPLRETRRPAPTPAGPPPARPPCWPPPTPRPRHRPGPTPACPCRRWAPPPGTARSPTTTPTATRTWHWRRWATLGPRLEAPAPLAHPGPRGFCHFSHSPGGGLKIRLVAVAQGGLPPKVVAATHTTTPRTAARRLTGQRHSGPVEHPPSLGAVALAGPLPSTPPPPPPGPAAPSKASALAGLPGCCGAVTPSRKVQQPPSTVSNGI